MSDSNHFQAHRRSLIYGIGGLSIAIAAIRLTSMGWFSDYALTVELGVIAVGLVAVNYIGQSLATWAILKSDQQFTESTPYGNSTIVKPRDAVRDIGSKGKWIDP